MDWMTRVEWVLGVRMIVFNWLTAVVVAALAMQERSGILLALGCPAAVRHGGPPLRKR
ncbi:hypothetical protein SAMN05216561_13030 [Nocardioides psychrotolerans]|uniref:Uncharacterized protein n=1 Tax=Nocardioides psychrotolerans TaxID=1005945 RepID=A0A1I3R9Y0_9ACTN|nr:hypothetical protein SAMN05216561_13030 [Nocardioides psychrotolerans]